MDDDPSLEERITLTQEDDWWVIKHEPTGIASQGKSRIHALLMLADALSGRYDERPLTELAEDVFVPDTDEFDFLDEDS